VKKVGSINSNIKENRKREIANEEKRQPENQQRMDLLVQCYDLTLKSFVLTRPRTIFDLAKCHFWCLNLNTQPWGRR